MIIERGLAVFLLKNEIIRRKQILWTRRNNLIAIDV